jgi:outer membrane protein W
MLTFGFGPMFKYSHYEVSLNALQNAKQATYSLDDMVFGAVFDVGLAFRIADTYALRFNVKYYWEKTKYWGGSLTFGFPF